MLGDRQALYGVNVVACSNAAPFPNPACVRQTLYGANLVTTRGYQLRRSASQCRSRPGVTPQAYRAIAAFLRSRTLLSKTGWSVPPQSLPAPCRRARVENV